MHALRRRDGLHGAAAERHRVSSEYKPGWNLSLLFAGRTSGGFADNTSRDFLSAMVTVDLPLFRDKRQDRTLAASQDEHAAAQFAQAHRLRADA
ncbi:MAG: hypothetical protein M3461_04545 [Pseudomonadota bacterium]|nr:hypothetical protein [Pseudomonadota bacterium]